MVADESKDARAEAAFRRELTEILVGIRKATKVFLTYPGNHPARTRVLEDTHKRIAHLLSRQAPLSLRISRDGFYHGETLVRQDHPLLRGFTLELFVRGIRTIGFLPGIRIEDLQHLTELCILDTADLSRQGGPQAFLRKRGATTVHLEDIDFTFIERSPEPTPEVLSTQTAGQIDPDAAQSTPTQSVTEAPEEEEAQPDLEGLILELKQTDRPARYEFLTQELCQWGREALARGEIHPCLRIMTALALELQPTSAKHETVTRYARSTIVSLVGEAGPHLVVEAFCRGETISEDDLVHLLLILSEEMAGPMVEYLLIEEQTAARRKLTDFLPRMGPHFQRAVIRALEDPDWETVRRLLPLLFKLPTPDIQQILRTLAGHEDPRVRREAMRTFANIDPGVARAPLLAALEDQDASVRQTAMATLGWLKAASTRRERPTAPVTPAAPAAPPPITRTITLAEGMTVKDLADKLDVRVKDVLAKLLMKRMMLTINSTMDVETAKDIAREFGAEIEMRSFEEELVSAEVEEARPEDVRGRAPVVTVMGHVDHGKTSLLDAIRETAVVETEAGGITQHIGAYQVDVDGRKVTFLDTPGHEAFTAMRARGAKVTDIAVLVVAADDGVMPQTRESISHARAAEVPIVVAVNKIDKPEANPTRVRQELVTHGLQPEEWGGQTQYADVSAKENQGLDDLVEKILLVADAELELTANPKAEASGPIIESRLDVGRGPVATLLVQNGTLRVSDSFIVGPVFGKVRALINDRGLVSVRIGLDPDGRTGCVHAGCQSPYRVVGSSLLYNAVHRPAREVAPRFAGIGGHISQWVPQRGHPIPRVIRVRSGVAEGIALGELVAAGVERAGSGLAERVGRARLVAGRGANHRLDRCRIQQLVRRKQLDGRRSGRWRSGAGSMA